MSTTDDTTATRTTLRVLLSDLLDRGGDPRVDLLRVDRYGEGPDGLSPGDGIGYGSLDPASCTEDADAVSLSVLVGSDYSGGALVRANVREVRRMVEEEDGDSLLSVVVDTYGGYGTDGVVFLLDREAPEDVLSEVADLLRGLLDYPAVSDEALSEQEHEEAEESWGNYACGDFARALARRVDPCGEAEIDDEGAEVDLRSLFSSVADSANVAGGPGVEHSDEGPYFYVDDVAEAVSPVLLFALRLVVLDGADVLDLVSSGDPDDLDEARRLRRLVRLGLGLRTVREALSRRIEDDTRKRREADLPEGGRLSEEARAAIKAEARRVSLDLLLSAEIDAGDTETGLPADLPRAQRTASVRFHRFRWNHETRQGTTLSATVEIDPEDPYRTEADALSGLFQDT